MKTNTELSATMHLVLTRLANNPKSPEEWEAIESALADAHVYAGKTRRQCDYLRHASEPVEHDDPEISTRPSHLEIRTAPVGEGGAGPWCRLSADLAAPIPVEYEHREEAVRALGHLAATSLSEGHDLRVVTPE